MAEALETKKRRLFKLLDNMSAADLPSDKSPSTSTTSSTKRSLTASERFDEARERASKRLRHSTSTASLSSLPPAKLGPSKTVATRAAADKPPPNFSPWSHDAFLARLKTFSSVSLWHPKPDAIGEVEWAKRGWRCVGVNTVACKGGCEKRVVVSLDAPARKGKEDSEEGEDDDEEEVQEAFERALVQRYQDVLAHGHAEHCMWRTSACRDDIYRVQVVRPSTWQPKLRARCHSILAIGPAIRDLTLQPLPTDGLKTQPASRLIDDLPPDLTASDRTSSDNNKDTTTRALTIALHGWRGAREAGSDLLHCDACFQRIGLWMYQPDYRRSNTTSDDEDDATVTLDLATLHREHCPWRNVLSQRPSGALAGLNASQILQRVATTYARDQRRRSAEQHQSQNPGPAGADEDEDEAPPPPRASREDVAKADKERESRLRRLKSLFSVRRKGGSGKAAATK